MDLVRLFRAFQEHTPVFYHIDTNRYREQHVIIGRFFVESVDLLNGEPYEVIGRNIDGDVVVFSKNLPDPQRCPKNKYPLEGIFFDLSDYIPTAKKVVLG